MSKFLSKWQTGRAESAQVATAKSAEGKPPGLLSHQPATVELPGLLELFAAARAKVARNLERGACPDCGGGLIANQLGAETAQYCAACDFTWRASDFAEIRATLARLKQHQKAA